MPELQFQERRRQDGATAPSNRQGGMVRRAVLTLLLMPLLPACESGGGELERLQREATLARSRVHAAEQRLEHLTDSIARLQVSESDSADYRAATALLREQVMVVRELRSQAKLAERDLGRLRR